QEAKRLHIPIVGIVDTNNSPRDIDFVVPGNDDALRAIDLYCTAAANACIEGSEAHQAELVAQRASQPVKSKSEGGSGTGRRVVDSAGGEKNEDKTASPAAPAAPAIAAAPAVPAAPATPAAPAAPAAAADAPTGDAKE
ncbi:MAG: 30S ribosomal protein S2, partial [bacterium]